MQYQLENYNLCSFYIPLHISFDFMKGSKTFSKVVARVMRPMMKGMLMKDYTKVFTNMRQLVLDDIASGKLNIETPAPSVETQIAS